ncbi:MAG TPA: ATP-binding protein [Saprospiraceae bacterium]|nr:ATP-binding protein [Saprospiraceae bacterium]HPI08440.1 ATP-binding protein [Saprospiraceae bacterium]
MKYTVACLLFYLFAQPFSLEGQNNTSVMDSLQRPLPAGATVQAQIEQCRSILWQIFRTEEVGYIQWSQRLDSLYHCCLAGKTRDTNYEKIVEAEVVFFKGSSVVYAEPQSARPFFEQAIAKYTAMKDSGSMALCYLQLVSVASGLGDSLLFDGYYRLANRLKVHVKDPYLITMFENNLGVPCYDFGLYAQAADHYFNTLALIEKYAIPALLVMERDVYHNLAGIYRRLDDTDNALRYTQKAIESSRYGGMDPSDHLEMMGRIYMQKNDYRRALESFLQIREVADLGSYHMNRIASKSYGMATCYRNLGQLDKALPLARKAVELLPVSRNVHFGGAALEELAQCEFDSGRVDQALEHGKAAYQAFVKGKNNGGSASCAELLTRIYKSKGNYAKALEYSELRYRFMGQIERQQSNRQLAFGEFNRNAEVEKAKREAEVKAQLTRQRNIRYVLFAGLTVLALLVFLLYNRFRLKQRTTQQLEAKNREIEAARMRAEASEAFKSRFLANMSHEIRTPLHGIAGFTDLLLETSLAEKQRRWLSSIHHSTERLGEVVNDILDLSKLEAGKLSLRRIPFSIDHICNDVQEALALRAENKGVELRLEMGDTLPAAVLGDPTRLYQILMNLVGNAVKFTEKGSVTLSVQVVMQSDERAQMAFAVTDTGIGIAPEQLATVFDSFRQAGEDTTARFGGTGLGLTIARELVQLHGSDILVESEVGRGSTFSFALTLPLADATLLKEGMVSGDALYYIQPIRILLADDSEMNREIAVEAIRRHFENAETVEAATGKEAIEVLATWTDLENRTTIVLMDMQMPEMTGPEATRYIRQHLSAHLPVIALTASATPEEIENALTSGMNRHLAKPFKPRELAQVIAETLDLQAQAPTHAFIPPVSAPVSATEIPGPFDLTFLRDFADGDEVQMQYFIRKFMAQYPLEISRLEMALDKGDGEAVFQVAHSLRPQLEFVGLHQAVSLTLEIEERARAGGDFAEMKALVGQLKADLNALPVG